MGGHEYISILLSISCGLFKNEVYLIISRWVFYVELCNKASVLI